jgi:hypothetical protein
MIAPRVQLTHKARVSLIANAEVLGEVRPRRSLAIVWSAGAFGVDCAGISSLHRHHLNDNNLMLRRPRSDRLEAWASGKMLDPPFETRSG